MDTQVLIIGAGPTGLSLALWLAKIGIKVRLIDRTAEPGTTSRALAVHARTLEFYRQLGIADEIVAAGFRFPELNLWVNLEKKAQISIDEIGRGVSPYPYVLILPQDQHEQLLINQLKKLNVEVERNTELLSFVNDENGICAKLQLLSGEVQECKADYIAGCDGVHSRVRQQLNLGFEGSTYPDLFYVADISGSGPTLNGELHISLDQAEFLAIFPMKDTGHARLIGVVRNVGDKKVQWSDVSPRLIEAMAIEVKEVHWFSTYHVHHRVARLFQKDRAFILGDAAHIHSPVGGQGMNTGIGDAFNLAWKLGLVLNGQASADLLKTYEIERMAFAKKLVKTTDQAFRFISSEGPFSQFVRSKIAPWLLPSLTSFRFVKKFIFRTVSQTGIHYRFSPLSNGEGGVLKAGDRLPWIESVDNFKPLQSLSWQIHIYGSQDIDVKSLNINVEIFDWTPEMNKKGLMKDKIYLIRPDGYIGMIASAGNEEDIRRYTSNATLSEKSSGVFQTIAKMELDK